jgi:hypothetical protein
VENCVGKGFKQTNPTRDQRKSGAALLVRLASPAPKKRKKKKCFVAWALRSTPQAPSSLLPRNTTAMSGSPATDVIKDADGYVACLNDIRTGQKNWFVCLPCVAKQTAKSASLSFRVAAYCLSPLPSCLMFSAGVVAGIIFYYFFVAKLK